jgi:hypothetical protein
MMSRKAVLVAALLVLSVISGAQESRQKPDRQMIFGPRVGATYMMIDPDSFDENMREVFREETEGNYFPLFTQFGIHLEQRIPLGNTNSQFVFQEVLLLGGLDQSAALPSASVLIGYRTAAGFEIGLGPNASLARSGDEIKIGISVAYGLGWTFTIEDVNVPVNFAAVPTPSDGHPRFTILTGFNFQLPEKTGGAE